MLLTVRVFQSPAPVGINFSIKIKNFILFFFPLILNIFNFFLKSSSINIDTKWLCYFYKKLRVSKELWRIGSSNEGFRREGSCLPRGLCLTESWNISQPKKDIQVNGTRASFLFSRAFYFFLSICAYEYFIFNIFTRTSSLGFDTGVTSTFMPWNNSKRRETHRKQQLLAGSIWHWEGSVGLLWYEFGR